MKAADRLKSFSPLHSAFSIQHSAFSIQNQIKKLHMSCALLNVYHAYVTAKDEGNGQAAENAADTFYIEFYV